MGFSEWTKQRQKDKKDTGSIGAQKTVPSAVAAVSGTSPVSFGEWTYRNRTQPANSKTAGKGQPGSGFSFADDYAKSRESFEPSQKYFADRKGKKAEESIAGSSGIKTDSSPAEDREKTEQSSVPYAQRAGIAQSTAMPYAAGLQAKQSSSQKQQKEEPEDQKAFSVYNFLPTPKGKDEKEELRMETRQRTQLANGVSPMELAWKEAMGQERTYQPTMEDLERQQELLQEELNRVKERLTLSATVWGKMQGQKVSRKELQQLKTSLENQLTEVGKQKQDKKLADWYTIPNRSDYAEHAQAGESKRGKGFWNSGDDLYDFINDIPEDGVGYRKLVEAMSVGTGQSEKYGGYTAYSYLTSEEVGIYNYLYNTEGKETADEFLGALEGSLNYRMGQTNFENMSVVGKGLYWLPQGVNRFAQGMRQRFSSEVIPTSPTQYTGGMIRQEIKDMGGVPSAVLGSAYDVGTMASSVIPGILAAWLLKAYNIPASTSAMMGNGLNTMSLMGNTYKAKRDEGWSEEQAKSYATFMGAGSMLLQQALGGIGALSGGNSASDKVIQAVLPKISGIENGCVRFVLDAGARIGIRGTAGGSMAAVQRLMEPLYTSMIRGEEYSVDMEDVTYAYLLGSLTSGLFELPNALRTAKLQLGLPGYVSHIEGYMGKENVDYFTECTSLEEVKTQYRSLAEKYHPDMGGDAGIMATINAQYDLQKGYYKGKAAGEAIMEQQGKDGEKPLALGDGGAFTSGDGMVPVLGVEDKIADGSLNGATNFVDDATADKLLNDQTSVAYLTEKGGLKLTRDMTREQKRAAIKDAVAVVIQGQKNVSGGETVDSTAIEVDEDGHTPEQRQIIKEYQANVDSALKTVFESYLANPKQGFSRYNISKVTQR